MRLPRALEGRRRRLLLARLVGIGVGQAAAAIGTALLVQSAFDRLVTPGARLPAGAIALAGAGLAAAAGATGLLRAVERVDAERLGQDYVHDVRMTLFARLARLEPRALQARGQGAVMLRFVGDLNALRQWVSLGLARLVVGATLVGVTGAALCLISPPVGLAVLGVLAAGLIGAWRLGRPLRETAREARRRRSRLAANLSERVAAMGVTQVCGQVEREARRTARQSRRLRGAMVARARVAGRLRGSVEVIAGLAAAAALLVGAAEVAAGRASPGTVVAGMTVVSLLVSPLRELGRVQEYWHASRVSVENLRRFLEIPGAVADLPGAPELAPGPGRLELDRVRVDGVIADATAVAEPGSLVVLDGANGSGKSTLLAVIARQAAPDGGAVRLDGQDLAECSLASLRSAIGVAGPDLPLLRGSLARNLAYRLPGADPDELRRVLRLCELDDVIRDAGGLGARIAEGGRNLSAGQRQRLAVARALVGRPRLLLLDEADANLDDGAREVLERVIAAHRGRATILLVTHRADLAARADAVWRLVDGVLRVERRRAAAA